MQIDGARSFGVKPGVEEALRIGQRRALEEIDLDVIFENPEGDDVALVRLDRRFPLPFFDDIGIGCQDQFSQARQQFAAPIG